MSGRIKMYDFPLEYSRGREAFASAIERVCESGMFSSGPFVREFEQAFAARIGTAFCAGVGCGTDALFLTFRALGVGPGDEVIVPSATFNATASAVMMCGAVPVFADCDPDCWELDTADVARKITGKTRAVAGVHLYGGMFDCDKALDICSQAGLPLIEDAAQAFGSTFRGRPAGSFGKAGCFSFYPTKNLGSFGNAGAAVSDDSALVDRIKSLRLHAGQVSGDHTELGYNMVMDDINASVLTAKLALADGYTARRRETAALYRSRLEDTGLAFQRTLPGVAHSYHLFVVLPTDRERFIAFMDSRGIDTGVQYRLPCHKQTVFRDRVGDVSLPNSERLMSRCVSVPVSAMLGDAEAETVAQALRDYAMLYEKNE